MGAITASYWDTATSGQPTGIGIDHNNQSSNVTGVTTAQLSVALPSGFSSATWGNVNNQTTPYLLSNPGPVYIGSDGTHLFALVFNMAELQAINSNLSGNYALATSLNAATDPTTPASWIPIGTNGAGYNFGTGFTGIFDGLGNTISNLTVNIGSSQYAGLFGYVEGMLRNVRLIGGSVTGGYDTGSLAGFDSGTITATYATTTVTGTANVGGLVGRGYFILDSSANGAVTGGEDTGGLVGFDGGSIQSSYATGSVHGTNYVGGLVGDLTNGVTVIMGNSYATGAVSGSNFAGGLAGAAMNANIYDSYATGAITGTGSFGGIGGLVGWEMPAASTNYISGSYWDTSTTGMTVAVGTGTATLNTVSGLTTAQLQGTLPAGFSASSWSTGTGLYPYLLWQYPSGTPQAISGFAYGSNAVAAEAAQIAIYVNGSLLPGATASSGANGYFYQLAPAGTVTSSTKLGETITLNGASGVSGLTSTDQPGLTSGNITNFNVTSGAVSETTADTSLSAVNSEQASVFGPGYSSIAFQISNPFQSITATSTPGFTIDVPLTLSNGLSIDETAKPAPITIADPITLQGANSLTLDGTSRLYVNAPISITGAGSVVITQVGGFEPNMTFGQNGYISYGSTNNGGSLTIDGTPYTLVYSMSDVQNINSGSTALSGNYALADSINAAPTTNWAPIGTSGGVVENSGMGFSGTFEGLGNTIANLTINGNSNSNDVGLLGYSTGMIRDVGLVGGSMSGYGDVGALAGANYGTIQNAYASSAVSGTRDVGGLAGANGGAVVTSYATGTVTGTGVSAYIGGLVGGNTTGSIIDSYATGAVSGMESVGGLVGTSGVNNGITLTSGGYVGGSYATGSVSGAAAVGGLIGYNSSTAVSTSHATGNVTDTGGDGGGLIGDNSGIGSAVTASYATGTVTATGTSGAIGGLIGNNISAVINGTYATGSVTSNAASGSVGGLVGNNLDGAIENSFAMGAVTNSGANAVVGGLIGSNVGVGGIASSYSTGLVTNTGTGSSVGGFAGSNGGGNATLAQSYWDVQTSGQSVSVGSDSDDQAGRVTGLTTAQLQGTLPTGFGNTVWGTGTALYPYLLWQFPAGAPQSVSGIVSNNGTAVTGQTVRVMLGGTDETALSMASGADGYYYDLVAPGTISAGSSTVLAYGQGSNGATLTDSATGSLTGFNLHANTLTEMTAAASYSAVESELAAAIGGNSAVRTIISALQNLTIVGSASSFTVDAPLTGATVDLVSNGGPLGQNANGTIMATTLTGSSAGNTILTDANNVANLGAFATGSNTFDFWDAAPLTVTGTVNAGNANLILVTSAGNDLSLNAPLIGSAVTLNSSGTIGENSAGVITAGFLAGSSSGNTTLNANNDIGNLDAFATNNGAFSLDDTAALTVLGAVNAGTGNLTLTSGGAINLYAPVAGATVDLVAGGPIGQNDGGTITASTFTGSSQGSAILLAQNAIVNLGSFSTNNNAFALINTQNLTIDGTVNLGTSYGEIYAGGTLSESGAGAITAQALTGSSTSATLNGNNAIAYLGGFTTSNGAFSLTDSESLAVTGTLGSAGNVTLTTNAGSDLAIYAPLSGTTVDLVSGGAISQNGAGTITATTLTGSSGTSTVLWTTNDIGTLGSFSANGGQFLLNDVAALSVTGPLSTVNSNLTLETTAGNNLAIDGAVTSLAVSLYSGGTITSNSAGVIVTSFLFGSSSGDATLTAGNYVANIQSFTTNNGDFSLTEAGAGTVLGAINTGTGNLTLTSGGNMTLYGPLTGATVDLVSGGAISQDNAGTITATTLTGSSTGSTILPAGNVITNLGSFSTTNAPFALTDNQGLTVTGALNVGASYAELYVGGTLSESGSGAITALALTGSSLDGTVLNGANALTYLGAFTTSFGAFSLTDSRSLAVTGTLSSTGNITFTTDAGNDLAIYAPLNGATVDLVSGGSISQNAGGTIMATTLTGSSATSTVLFAANAVRNLGSFTTSGGQFLLNDAAPLTVTGSVNADNYNLTLETTAGNNLAIDGAVTGLAVSLYSGGTITGNSAGVITTSFLFGSSSDDATLTANNNIGNLQAFTTNNGDFSLTDTAALTVLGAVDTGTGNLTLNSGGSIAFYAPVSGATVDLVSGGTIGQNSVGIVTATTLTGSSSGQVTLTNAGNAIDNLGNFSTDNANFYLTDSTSLTETGTISTGTGSAHIVSSGTITVDAAQTVSGSATLTLDASDALAINAPVTVTGAGTVVLDAGYDSTTVPGSSPLELSFGPGGNISYGSTNNGGALAINGTPYTLLYTMGAVQNVNSNLTGSYALATSLDASAVASWTPIGTDGAGNVLNSGNGFGGTFEGLGNTISNLTINLPSASYVGLFGYAGPSATVADVKLTNGNMTGLNYIGELVGFSSGIVEDVGVAGTAAGAVIESGGFTSSDTGGLVGHNDGTIVGSSAATSITGGQGVGGLVGTNYGTVLRAYASGSVSGAQDSVGGLVGGNVGTVSQSYATGGVTGDVYSTGGLVGGNNSTGVIINSYATGTVSGPYWYNSGGLVGQNSGAITSSYSTGAVTGFAYVGGLVGFNNNGTIAFGVWDTQTSGLAVGIGQDNNSQSGNVTGLTTAQLQAALPAGFSGSIWALNGNINGGLPYLQALLSSY